jgi:putative flippase GtrA
MSVLIDKFTQRLSHPGITGQIMRFTIVGLLGFVVDAAILKSFVYLGAGPIAARVVSLAGAVTFTWALNRSMTFAAGVAPSWREYSQYILNSLVGMLINYATYSAAVFLHVPLLISLAIGTVAGSVFNFVAYRILWSKKA